MLDERGENPLKSNVNKDVFVDLTSYTEHVKKAMHASGSALVVMKDNKIIHESYSGTHHFEEGAREIDHSSRFNVYSVRVTYVGLAIAIAIDEGYLSLDDRLSKFLTEYDEAILGHTTIRHLLTRSTGLSFEQNKVVRNFEVGTNIEGKRPDVLAKILTKATGKTVNEMLTEKVFEPLHLTHTGWVTEGERNLVSDIDLSKNYPTLRIGSNVGDDRNLYVSARELALWGNLHLYRGLIDGEQALSKDVFKRITTMEIPRTIPRTYPTFRFLWWMKDRDVSVHFNELGSDLPTGSYQILGASGCSCTVIPAYNAVIVRMYNSVNASENVWFNYIEEIQEFGNLTVSSLRKF